MFYTQVKNVRKILEASVQMVPSTWVELTNEDDIKNMRKMLEIMDENDDIQNVYTNWQEP
jgi:transcriptional/translational regulatory protein YebC/TACO1